MAAAALCSIPSRRRSVKPRPRVVLAKSSSRATAELAVSQPSRPAMPLPRRLATAGVAAATLRHRPRRLRHLAATPTDLAERQPPPLHRELLVHSPCCHDDARGQQQATPVSRTSPGVADPFFAEHLTAKAELCPPRRWPTWTAVTPSEPSPGDLDAATPTPCRPRPAPHLAATTSAPSRGTRTSSRNAEQQQGSDTDLAPTTRVAQPPRQQRGGRDVVTLAVRR